MDDLELTEKRTMNFIDLPIEMRDHILSFLSYDQIAKLRPVSKLFNTICGERLNKGFFHVEQFHNKCLKAIKAKLPRRESERKHHPLARHSDIMMAVETRLSMLSMTFTKYIDSRHCYFIPGKVLDEALKVLRIVSNSCAEHQDDRPSPTVLPRPHEFLQEYRDISSMAMEHFDEKILPGIKEKLKKENHTLFSAFKVKQSITVRPYLRLIKMPIAEQVFGDSDFVKQLKNRETCGNCLNQKPPSVRLVKMAKILKQTRKKFTASKKSLTVLHNKVKFISSQMRFQNIMYQRKLDQQKNTIDHLRGDLRKTRNAFRKDLNFLKTKLLQRERLCTIKKVTKRLAVTKTSCISIPATDELPLSKGIKRKRDSSDDKNTGKP